jgi:hypothetical protein
VDRVGRNALRTAPSTHPARGARCCHRTTPVAGPQPATPSVNERFLSQLEAARLAGCSKDTIVRARRKGRFPHARLRGHCWTIPVDDLFAAGLYRADEDASTVPAKERQLDAEQTPAMALELERAVARVAALEDLVARQDDELAFLRQLAVERLTTRGPG